MNKDILQAADERTSYAAYVAIDWADQKHDVRIRDARSGSYDSFEIEHTPEALTEFVTLLRRRFDSQPVALAVELKRGPLINFLCAYEFIDIHPVKTTTLSHFRQAFYPSGAKSDPLDCELIHEILLKHPDRLEDPWKPDTPEMRLLAELTQARREFVDQVTKLSQKLRACLKNYHPLAIEILNGTLDNRLACDFLLRWPSLPELRKARDSTIRGFFVQHKCRGKRIDKVLKLREEAVALTKDEAIIEGQSFRALTLLKQIRALLPAIEKYDARIKELFEGHEDAFIYESLPGAGAIMAPRLMAVTGSRRERFAHSNNYAQYSGVAPVTERSGKRIIVHWRWSSPVFVRQSFVEFARWSITQCSWAQAYNELLRERGDGGQTRMRKIAYKWTRIIHRCWQARTAYDDQRYVESLRRANSPVWRKLQQLQAPEAAAA